MQNWRRRRDDKSSSGATRNRSVLQEQRWNNQGQAVQVWKVQENIFLFSRENIFLFSISRASEENLPFTWN
jgi:hypothetical protein